MRETRPLRSMRGRRVRPAVYSISEEYARSSGLLSLMDAKLRLKMKTVKYSWQDKLKELMCSIVSGCEHTVSINHRLVPDTTLAKELIGKDRFAEQSGVNKDNQRRPRFMQQVCQFCESRDFCRRIILGREYQSRDSGTRLEDEAKDYTETSIAIDVLLS